MHLSAYLSSCTSNKNRRLTRIGRLLKTLPLRLRKLLSRYVGISTVATTTTTLELENDPDYHLASIMNVHVLPLKLTTSHQFTYYSMTGNLNESFE